MDWGSGLPITTCLYSTNYRNFKGILYTGGRIRLPIDYKRVLSNSCKELLYVRYSILDRPRRASHLAVNFLYGESYNFHHGVTVDVTLVYLRCPFLQFYLVVIAHSMRGASQAHGFGSGKKELFRDALHRQNRHKVHYAIIFIHCITTCLLIRN